MDTKLKYKETYLESCIQGVGSSNGSTTTPRVISINVTTVIYIHSRSGGGLCLWCIDVYLDDAVRFAKASFGVVAEDALVLDLLAHTVVASILPPKIPESPSSLLCCYFSYF